MECVWLGCVYYNTPLHTRRCVKQPLLLNPTTCTVHLAVWNSQLRSLSLVTGPYPLSPFPCVVPVSSIQLEEVTPALEHSLNTCTCLQHIVQALHQLCTIAGVGGPQVMVWTAPPAPWTTPHACIRSSTSTYKQPLPLQHSQPAHNGQQLDEQCTHSLRVSDNPDNTGSHSQYNQAIVLRLWSTNGT